MTTTTIDQAAAQLAGHQGFSIISNETLRQLYISMVKSRLLEARLREVLLNGKLESSLGREAAFVGALTGLLPEDEVAAAPENLMVCFLRNELQGKPLQELLNRDAETDFASQLTFALRTVQDNKREGKSAIAVVFSEGDSGFSEKLLKQARAKRLPVLFVRPVGILSEAFGAQSCGVPVIPVDGADVVAVYRVATESITHARKGNGPTLIECFFDPAEACDPVQKMAEYLTRKGDFRFLWTLEEADSFHRQLDAAIQAAKR
ncbi:MAG: thiamine pyrophosphate-dependent enzyme [Terracidiphilus sp.]